MLAACLLAAAAAHAQINPYFSPVPATSATESQRQGALFFRSAYVEDHSPAPLVSLNPADPKLVPAILDGSTGSLTPLPAGTIDGVQVLRPLELGIFNGRFAAAKALIQESSKEREAWGYVDRRGRWVIAPRYDRAEMPVNRWGKVGMGEARYIQNRRILDLERRTAVELPEGRAPRYDALVPLGPHLAFSLLVAGAKDDGSLSKPFLVNAMTGEVMPLPSLPAATRGESGGQIILGDNRIFDIASGRIVSTPSAGYAPNWILPGVAKIQNQVGGRLDIQIFKPATQTLLTKDLRAVEPLTSELFIACDQGENAWPVVRRGRQEPYPFDPNSKLRCGLMDAEGRWRVASRYQHFYLTENGQIVMRSASEWCTLDPRAASSPVCSEKAPAAMLNAGLRLDVEGPIDNQGNSVHLYGYRDSDDKLVIPYQFERASPFVGQLARVSKLGVQGLIDTQGRWLTPPPPSHVVPLVLEGNARSAGTPCESCFGLIDRGGRWVWPPVFNLARPAARPDRLWVRGHGDNLWFEANSSGQAHRAPVSMSNYEGHTAPTVQLLPNQIVATAVNGVWGLTDAHGNWLVSPRFGAVDVVSDARALARTKDGWGLINTQGTWLIPPRYARFEALNDGLTTACASQEGRCETFNLDGVKIDLPEALAAAEPFGSQGIAAAQVRSSGLWGYLDRNGRWLIEPRFTKAYPFAGKFALAQANKSEEDITSTPQPRGSPYLISGVSLWPRAKLALVTVLPSPTLKQAQERDWSWKSSSAITGNAVTGLMNTQGQWLVPVKSRWPASR